MSLRDTATNLLSILILLLLSSFARGAQAYNERDVIQADVCVIGGGSSGTYTAIRLQQLGKSVTLIEREDRLGGHVNTYQVPDTNQTFDYGVIVFANISVVRNYFEYLDVDLVPTTSSGGSTVFADFADGSIVNASSLDSGNATAALQSYQEQLDRYPYLINGFNLPSPVPEDLLLPWGDFLRKYDLGAMAYEVWTYNQGVGNILALPTLYMIKYLNAEEVINLQTDGFLASAGSDNQRLYDNALAKLGLNVLLSSNVTSVERTAHGVTIQVRTLDGDRKILASQLVIAIPPLLSNLGFLDLDALEHDVFSQFNNSFYWDAVIKDTGLAENTSYNNADPAAPWGIPPSPGLYSIGSTGFPGLWTAYYSSPYYISNEDVQADVLDTIARLVNSSGLPPTSATPQFVGFNAHNPFELQVSTEAIESGFYGDAQALQGHRRTRWTGAAWQAQDSSYIWNFTESVVLPDILSGQEKTW